MAHGPTIMENRFGSDESIMLFLKTLNAEDISLLCDIQDRRSRSVDSLDRWEKKAAANVASFLTSENYANGTFYLLNDEGYDLVRVFKLMEAEWAAEQTRKHKGIPVAKPVVGNLVTPGGSVITAADQEALRKIRVSMRMNQSAFDGVFPGLD